VLAHELGHHVHHDIWRLLALSVATLGVGIAGAWAAVEAFAPDGAGHVSMLPAAVLGFSLASAVVSPLAAAYSRRRERAADAYAAALAGEGETFARAMERLVARNLSELEPPRLYYLLTASHPTPAERIAVARSGGHVPAA
jgi:STE24 endopeptidase